MRTTQKWALLRPRQLNQKGMGEGNYETRIPACLCKIRLNIGFLFSDILRTNVYFLIFSCIRFVKEKNKVQSWNIQWVKFVTKTEKLLICGNSGQPCSITEMSSENM